MSEREVGQVKWFSTKKGYGFVVRDTGEEIFMHISGLNGRFARDLSEGEEVEFEVMHGDRGPQAVGVIMLNPKPRSRGRGGRGRGHDAGAAGRGGVLGWLGRLFGRS